MDTGNYRFASSDSPAVPVTPVEADALDGWMSGQPADIAGWVRASGYKGGLGEVCPIPDPSGAIARVLLGWGKPAARGRGRFHLARAASKLPAGTYRLDPGPTPLPEADALEAEALGWLLAGYGFRRYRKAGANGDRRGAVRLVAPEGVDIARVEAMAAGEVLTRDLINTPASDMGPEELETALRALAEAHGAEVEVTTGDMLLEGGFPMIHAVGRASSRAPRLVDLRWGPHDAPRLTLVGKGVCFDTGGLNLKPGNFMGLMKKDMGGAATAAGLAHMIMALKLPVRLRLLVPAVENAVSGSALRPGDILTARNGLTVEVNNTDAEGRLVLADALALAAEEETALTVTLATLTGAARVALGPELPALFCDDDAVAAAIDSGGRKLADPVWRLPLWPGYERLIEPGIADLDNAPSGGMAGAITAALFLRRFAGSGRYAHLDLYGWSQADAPATPKGGQGQGARAILAALPTLLSPP